MNLQEILKTAGATKKRKRIGRGHGSGHGGTSGRGHKGAGSRAGWKTRGMAEGGAMPMFRRLPKRGFNNFHFRTEYSVVNVGELDAVFDNGSHVTAQLLHEIGLIRTLDKPVKILGDGTIGKKLKVDANKFSNSAAEKIKAAGGEAKVI